MESAVALADLLVSSGTSPSRRLVRREERERVRGALEQLGEQDREIVLLRFLEQLSTEETAAVLGISAGGVKSRLMRALVRIRSLLGDESGEDER